MINEKRVKLMTRLAHYESNEGKKTLPVIKYYRGDYVGLGLIKNFFLIGIGYLLILAVLIGANAEYLLDNANKMNFIALGAALLIGLLIVLAVYTVLTYVYYSVRYSRAKRSVSEYQENLKSLSRLYAKDDKSGDYKLEEEEW